MRFVYGIVFLLLAAGLIYVLDSRAVLPAPLGRLLSPQQGIWQNAEPLNEDFSEELRFTNLKGKTEVYFDERLVPHVFAEQTEDAYFVQGFLHAKFRLWQMELQAKAAAGNVSEIIGEKGLEHDRQFRRLGMVYAAENSLAEMEKDPVTKASCDAYTAGVNAYIKSLTNATLPIEYKLIGYQPEAWSNFKSALFLKYMSFDLAGFEQDFELTNAHNYFSAADFALLFPAFQDSLDPIIPKGAGYAAPSITPVTPAFADSVYFAPKPHDVQTAPKPDKENGSNNWAVAGSKTASGAPILCNDPHLGLNLPSLWYEIQLNTPDFNAYGVSFPGAPSVIIGFNDSCSFGFTNGGRDVRDYYEIKFRDESRKEYFFNGEWKQTNFRYERIRIAGRPDFIDTVAYTLFGPVMYDKSFGDKSPEGKNYAVRWKAHDPSNELLVFNRLNYAKNYDDYLNAVKHLSTPGQNCVFASKSGDIALRTEGAFPAKWKGQGDFVMPGTDSSYMWQGIIPEAEVPNQHNPERGFVSSANQRPVDSSYAYYLGRAYPLHRGLRLNKRLSAMNGITPKDMQNLQLDNYNSLAAMASPVMAKYVKDSGLSASATSYLNKLRNWNFIADREKIEPVIFQEFWDAFYSRVYDDEFAAAPANTLKPALETLPEMLLRDTAYKFLDDRRTVPVESIVDIATQAFEKAAQKVDSLVSVNKDTWGKYKGTIIYHLAKLPEFSVPVNVSGSSYSLNANKMDAGRKLAHGPSWRMVVSLTKETEAYGVYPGGQSGNPGSRFYKSFISDWTEGNYYPLWVMKKGEEQDSRVIGKMIFSN